MKEAPIPYIQGIVNWDVVPKLTIGESLYGKACTAAAFAQICRSNDALILHMAARNQEVRREENGLLGMPCHDSCLEFFFCPDEQDLRYLNIEFNANGCLYLGFGSGPEDHMRIVIDEAAQRTLFSPKIAIGEDGWDLYFQVPYALIRRFFPDWSPAAGKAIRANFYNCGDNLAEPHYLTWNPICREGRMLFHTPAQFGLLRFE